MENLRPEILINSSLVSHHQMSDTYEFVLNQDMCVIECVKVKSITKGLAYQVKDANTSLEGMLFELNHVRVNPRVDNSIIVDSLTQALEDIGVKVFNPPAQNTMAVLMRPLGEISDTVRFHLDGFRNKLIFMSPTSKPHLVVVQKKQPVNMHNMFKDSDKFTLD